MLTFWSHFVALGRLANAALAAKNVNLKQLRVVLELEMEHSNLGKGSGSEGFVFIEWGQQGFALTCVHLSTPTPASSRSSLKAASLGSLLWCGRNRQDPALVVRQTCVEGSMVTRDSTSVHNAFILVIPGVRVCARTRRFFWTSGRATGNTRAHLGFDLASETIPIPLTKPCATAREVRCVHGGEEGPQRGWGGTRRGT